MLQYSCAQHAGHGLHKFLAVPTSNLNVFLKKTGVFYMNHFISTERLLPSKVAMLLILNAYLYADEKSKEISRYRFTKASLKRISNRQNLRQAFVEELREEFLELGWLLIVRDADYAILNLDKTDTWVRLNSQRLSSYKNLDEADLLVELSRFTGELESTDEELLDL